MWAASIKSMRSASVLSSNVPFPSPAAAAIRPAMDQEPVRSLLWPLASHSSETVKLAPLSLLPPRSRAIPSQIYTVPGWTTCRSVRLRFRLCTVSSQTSVLFRTFSPASSSAAM